MSERDGFSPREKKDMLLSPETMTGLRFTGMCIVIVELVVFMIIIFCKDILLCSAVHCGVGEGLIRSISPWNPSIHQPTPYSSSTREVVWVATPKREGQ